MATSPPEPCGQVARSPACGARLVAPIRGSGRAHATRRPETPDSGPSPRADTGPESDTGLAHDVQICCKGARAPHALPTEPRNHAVSPQPHGPRNGLCNRFGQPTAPLDHPQPGGPRPATPNEPGRARSRGPGSRGECATSPLRPPPRPRGGAGPPADPRGAPAARAKITDE